MTLSERVADQLAHDPSIMDVMAEPDYLKITPRNIVDTLRALDLQAYDFETAMNTVRIIVKELRFRLTLAALEGQLRGDDIMALCSVLAEETITALLPVAARETERVFGTIKGEYGVVGLGKLGGREMRLTSDLDIMLLYDAHPSGESRPDIYTKLTQRLVSALSAITGEGGLQLEESLQTAISYERPNLDMKSDISEMLRRTRAAKPAQSEWDIKNMAGGLRDIEYIAQTLWLLAKKDNATTWPRSTHDMLMYHNMSIGEDMVLRLSYILSDYHVLQQWQAILGLSIEADKDDMTEFMTSELGRRLSLNFEGKKRRSAQSDVTHFLSSLLET